MITNSALHHLILQHIIDHGYAPDLPTMADLLQSDPEEVVEALRTLQEYHGVVLHPHEPKVWVIHPFSLAPTTFYVTSARGEWWGNCAWCSLGVAALLKEDVRIRTVLGGETTQITLHIVEGELKEDQYVVHFPIPMQEAWNNVIYTCSNMLIFENEAQVDRWVEKHGMRRGDVQPIGKIWQFSKKWYGSHLDPQWIKWTVDEAKEIFAEFDLTGPIWDLGESKERF